MAAPHIHREPISMLGLGAGERVGLVAGALVLLWGAVLWALT